MTRLIVHAGFHKTGTTTVQKTLRKNRVALRPHARIVLRPGMIGLCEAARAYSESRSEIDLGFVKFEAAALAETLKKNATTIISSEDLSGHMPGRRGLTTYDAVPDLMSAIDQAFRRARPKASIEYIFVTREADTWLRSCHVQHLRATRMTLNARDYARKFRKSSRLDHVIKHVEQAVPNSTVRTFTLEACNDRLGPLQNILDAAMITPETCASLVTIPPANTAPPAAKAARLLELNQSNLSDEDLQKAKRALNGEAF